MDFSSLKTQAASLLDNREDEDIDVIMAGAVAAAEDRMNDDLRIREMLVTIPVPLVNGVGTLPDDYLAFRAPKDGTVDITIGEDEFTVIPGRWVPAGPYQFTYYAKIPPLGPALATNKVLAAHPMLYLYAVCAEAAPTWEAMGGPMTAKFEGQYAQKLERVRKTDLRARFNTQNRRMNRARP